MPGTHDNIMDLLDIINSQGFVYAMAILEKTPKTKKSAEDSNLNVYFNIKNKKEKELMGKYLIELGQNLLEND